MKKTFLKTAVVASTLSLFGGAVVSAQQVIQNGQPGTVQPGANQQGSVNANASASANAGLDDHAAACLILGNQNEVAVAKLAEENAKNSKVKSFAERMRKDHNQFIDELTKFTTQNVRNRDTNTIAREGGSRDNDQRNNPNSRQQTATGNLAAQGTIGAAGNLAQQQTGNDPWASMMQMKRELADQCLTSANKELNRLKGGEFDECYVGMQIGAHMHMIDELKVLERHVSPRLQSVLREGRETAEKHLEMAKDIKKELASSDRRSSDKTDK